MIKLRGTVEGKGGGRGKKERSFLEICVNVDASRYAWTSIRLQTNTDSRQLSKRFVSPYAYKYNSLGLVELRIIFNIVKYMTLNITQHYKYVILYK